jgi:hypothetical protein
MRDEYEFTPDELRNGIRGKYAARFQEGVNLAVLEKLIGTVEAPSDWAAEHDHYLYGTPKRADQEP